MDRNSLKYRSHGKLLITGEYLVMYGARALALPLKFGQTMEVSHLQETGLIWEAAIQDQSWFKARLSIPELSIIGTEDEEKTAYLIEVLQAARELNPDFLAGNAGYRVITQLDYPQEWGLGSSSSFISNIASWAEVSAMELNKKISSGSGYDIACTRADSAIVYQIRDQEPVWENIEFKPSWKENMYFLYLGKKQDTAGSIREFKSSYQSNPDDINYISWLTDLFLTADSVNEAVKIIDNHEQYLSDILKIAPVKERLFRDFDGAVKSLGAWGGDFAMIISARSFGWIKEYFHQKGYDKIFSYTEIRLEK